MRDEGAKGSNEEEEIAQRQEPASNRTHCRRGGGNTRKSLRRENQCKSMHTGMESNYKQREALPLPPA